ncbi:MAG: divalent-cation tolerance protein CutA [Saprospiraceae bacterium]|nr:divalent-cation tolerance protein CutA [Saprospiraceae bacterium]
MPFLVFYVTCPDEDTARNISQHLLQQRLVACANMFPISSAFWWDGAIQQDREWVALLKTQLALEAALEAEIQGLHPYDTPCILRVEARANAAYEAWILASTRDAL